MAATLKTLSQYEPSITEIHHTAKADKPSGTAIALAENILDQTSKTKWISDDPSVNEFLNITSIREGNVTGTHTLEYKSDFDTISLTHNAHNRKGFASGAMLAASFVINKKGVFSMNDILEWLNINKE
jgi:4-hydroxy-tetrahydrodipicolinate reductase